MKVSIHSFRGEMLSTSNYESSGTSSYPRACVHIYILIWYVVPELRCSGLYLRNKQRGVMINTLNVISTHNKLTLPLLY